MPGGMYWSDGVSTSLGWINPLDIFYDTIVDEIRQICNGEASVGDSGTKPRFEHAAVFGRNDITMTLSRMENIFHVILIKLTVSIVAASPNRLSSDSAIARDLDGKLLPDALTNAWTWQ